MRDAEKKAKQLAERQGVVEKVHQALLEFMIYQGTLPELSHCLFSSGHDSIFIISCLGRGIYAEC